MSTLMKHYIMFCTDTYKEHEFLTWVHTIDVDDLQLIHDTWS
jgi:hypothetical protein